MPADKLYHYHPDGDVERIVYGRRRSSSKQRKQNNLQQVSDYSNCQRDVEGIAWPSAACVLAVAGWDYFTRRMDRLSLIRHDKPLLAYGTRNRKNLAGFCRAESVPVSGASVEARSPSMPSSLLALWFTTCGQGGATMHRGTDRFQSPLAACCKVAKQRSCVTMSKAARRTLRRWDANAHARLGFWPIGDGVESRVIIYIYLFIPVDAPA